MWQIQGTLVSDTVNAYCLPLATNYIIHAGINVNESWTYNASVFYKFPEDSTFTGNITASLISLDGTVFGSASAFISATSATNWTQLFVKLKPIASAPSLNNSFQITFDGEVASNETVFFSLFSLFPPTYKNRENGMRADLAQTLADLKPAFFRFPGGSNLVSNGFVSLS